MPTLRPGSLRRYAVGAASIGVTALLWQWAVTGPLADKPFATVPEILGRLRDFAGDPLFWSSLGETFRVAAIGLVISVVLGVAAGLLVGQSDLAYRSTRVLVEFLKPIPPIVILPLLVLVLGPTGDMGIFLVAFGGVFPLITQTAHGVHDVDPVAAETARSFRLTGGSGSAPWWRRRRCRSSPPACGSAPAPRSSSHWSRRSSAGPPAWARTWSSPRPPATTPRSTHWW